MEEKSTREQFIQEKPEKTVSVEDAILFVALIYNSNGEKRVCILYLMLTSVQYLLNSKKLPLFQEVLVIRGEKMFSVACDDLTGIWRREVVIMVKSHGLMK